MNQTDGYMSVEASLMLPLSFMVILLVLRLWFFRYDSVLQEMDTAAVVVRTLQQQDLNSEEKAQYAVSQIQNRYKDQYIAWTFGDIRAVCRGNYVECTLCGECGQMPGVSIFGELGEVWQSSVTRTRRIESEVFVIRTYRKVLGAGSAVFDGK